MSICLFCKSETNSFLSVEHIFPESLGSKEKILPKGVVCDECNNGILSVLDSELVNFDVILFLRTFYGIETKKGSVPRASFSTVSLENPSKKHINLVLKRNNKNDFIKTHEGFNLKFTGRKKMSNKNMKLLARALYKIGLELLCLDHGIDFCLSSRFDEVRKIILGKRDFHGYICIGSNKTIDKVGVTYRFFKTGDGGKELALFEFNYMFLKIVFDMEQRECRLENGAKILGLDVLRF
ncbi:MAG: HNH endonuclease [Patescibacteria group bacterium]|jgi:hypothetical protein|nr:HNH endonuclease [Patescibacteria group bacterium]